MCCLCGGGTTTEIINLIDEHAFKIATEEDKKQGYRAIHIAASQADDKDLKFLLRKGASADSVAANGKRVLHVAIESFKPKYLIGHDGIDYSKFYRAKQISIIKLLIKARVNLAYRDVFNNTALHMAADKGLTEIVSLLVKAGADKASLDGYNIPTHAVLADTSEPKLWVDSDFSDSLRICPFGRSPLELALKHKNPKLEALLSNPKDSRRIFVSPLASMTPLGMRHSGIRSILPSSTPPPRFVSPLRQKPNSIHGGMKELLFTNSNPLQSATPTIERAPSPPARRILQV